MLLVAALVVTDSALGAIQPSRRQPEHALRATDETDETLAATLEHARTRAELAFARAELADALAETERLQASASFAPPPSPPPASRSVHESRCAHITQQRMPRFNLSSLAADNSWVEVERVGMHA